MELINEKALDERMRRIAEEVTQLAISNLPKVDAEALLTVEELAVILKKGASSVYRDASQGRIPGYRMGDSWRFRLSEVLEACKSRNLKIVDSTAA